MLLLYQYPHCGCNYAFNSRRHHHHHYDHGMPGNCRMHLIAASRLSLNYEEERPY